MGVRINFTPSPELYPFESRWLELDDGLRVHYVDEGAGRPLVMCHGNPMWSFLYRKLIIRLRDQFRCVAMDMPGFGLSDRPGRHAYTPAEHVAVLRRLVDHLDLREFIVMAQDWGGPVGMGLAAAEPARVSGLVFMNTFYWPINQNLIDRLLVMGAPVTAALVTRCDAAVPMLVRLGTSTKLTAEELEHYVRAQPCADARQGVVELPRHLRSSWLAELAERAPVALRDQPVLLIWGMKDPLLGRPSVLRRWRMDFPRAEVITLPHANHYIQEDAPGEIADAVSARFGDGP